MAYRRGAVIAALACSLLLGFGAALSLNPASGQDPASSGSGGVSDAEVIAFINKHIEQQWQDNKITPSARASDHEWLRRVHLDTVGRIPTIQEINEFLKRPAESRRKKEVEILLKDEDYAKNWANLWTVWLLTRTSPAGIDREAMHGWLEESFALNKPYSEIVRELLTATGEADKNGPANFILSHVGERNPPGDQKERGQFEMVPVTSRTTKIFLGTQTQCTQCHDHPFIDSRKQTSYWGVNAFFRQVRREPELIMMRRQDTGSRHYTLKDDESANPDGGVFFEKRNGLLLRTSPVYLNGEKLPLSAGVNRRAELMKLMLKDEMFAKALVNRMWAHFMGRGFTNPVDDFGEHNPVSHPELLDGLGKYFAQSGYDLRRLITWITSSKPYHLTSMANDSNKKADAEPYFARMLLKAMTPEQLVDSIFVATNAEKTRASKEEQRKLYKEWLDDFTVNFGDDEGNEATFNGTVVQALLLMNGSKLNDAISARPGSTVQQASALRSGQINRLYLSALSRPPTGSELSLANRLAAYNSTKDPAKPLQDILWALINSNEFILNH